MLTACEKTSVDSAFISNGTVKAFIAEEESQTRTALNGSKIIWSEDDKISIFTEYTDNTFKNNQGKINNGVGTTSADFNVVYETGYTNKVVAVYPYNANTSYDGKVTINMPNTYSNTEGSINGFPMAAKISDQNAPIAFKNAGALMQLTVNNIPAGYNSATLAANTQIAGECTISFNESIPTMVASNNADDNKKIVISWEPTNQMTNKTFYFPLPIANYDNLTFSISNGSQTIEINSKALNAQRSKRYTGAWTLGVASGSTPTEASSASAANTALADGNTAVNVTISESETATPTLSLPKQNTPESTPTTLSFNSIPTGKTVTIQEANGLANEEKPSENVYIYASSDTNSNNSFDINLPKSTVTLNATSGTAVYETVTALTADNTLVVGNGVTVNKLVVKGGNVRVHGTISAISRHKDNENPVYLYVEEGANIPAELDDEFIVVSNGVAEVSTEKELIDATTNVNISEIKLTANIASNSVIWIKRNLTLDLNKKTLSATTDRLVRVSTDSDNNPIAVTIKNGKILNEVKDGRCVETRSGNVTLNLNGVELSTPTTGVNQPLTIGGSGENIKVNISNNSTISTNKVSGYAITTFNPVAMTVENSTVEGWCAFNIKVASGSVGSAGSTFDVKGSTLIGANAVSEGETNGFTTIMIEDKNITFNVDAKSTVIADATNSNSQTLVTIGNEAIEEKGKITGTKVTFAPNATLTLRGDNAKPMGINAGEKLEGNTFKFPKAFAETLENHNWIVSDPDANSLVTVTGQIAEVGTTEELATAAANSNIKVIKLTADITSTETLEITRDLTINLNGKTFVNNVKAGRAFKVTADGAKFSLNAVNSNVTFGNDTYGIVEIANDVDNAVVAIEGGNFEGATNAEMGGTFVRFRNGNNNTVSLTKLTYTDNYKFTDGKEYNPWVVYGTEGKGNTLNVEGGTYNVPCGFNLNNVTSNFKNITLYAIGQGMELSGSNGKYELNGCKIMLNPGGIAYTAPGACVAASYMSTINVEGGVLTANQAKNTYTLAVYPTGGYINYDSSKTELNGETKVWDMTGDAKGAITDTSSLPE